MWLGREKHSQQGDDDGEDDDAPLAERRKLMTVQLGRTKAARDGYACVIQLCDIISSGESN